MQQLVLPEGIRSDLPDSVTLVPMVLPGSSPLRDPKKERFCRLRAVLRPKADAYRQAGWKSESAHAAAGNASRLERRQDIAERIAYLSRQEEEILRIKRDRIEEFLWTVHEANISEMWEVVEVEKRDHKGNPVINEDGSVVMKTVQRPKSISEMPEDVQRAVESISINEAGFVVPKPYSKLQANQELRKMLGIGSVPRDDGELSRLTDQELVAQLASQARELGIEVDLTYRFGGQ